MPLNLVTATLWKDANPSTPGEFRETLAQPILNATRVFINDFKMVMPGAPPTVPNFIRIKFQPDGNNLEANDAVLPNQFVIFPIWDPVALTFRQQFSYPGQPIAFLVGRQVPFRSFHCKVYDEFNNLITYSQLGIKFAVEYDGFPNSHQATSQDYQNVPVGLYNAGTPY